MHLHCTRSKNNHTENTFSQRLISRKANVNRPTTSRRSEHFLWWLSAICCVALMSVQSSIATAAVQTPPNPASVSSPVTSAEVIAMDKVGSIAGQFQVDNGGGATYSVPIYVPEGTAGAAPTLNLTYSSGRGNGIAGLGWGISGLSSINRCRQTLQQDMEQLPIQWNADDRFCLDGQRLLLVSGTYGSSGSTYRTELDNFASAISFCELVT